MKKVIVPLVLVTLFLAGAGRVKAVTIAIPNIRVISSTPTPTTALKIIDPNLKIVTIAPTATPTSIRLILPGKLKLPLTSATPGATETATLEETATPTEEIDVSPTPTIQVTTTTVGTGSSSGKILGLTNGELAVGAVLLAAALVVIYLSLKSEPPEET